MKGRPKKKDSLVRKTIYLNQETIEKIKQHDKSTDTSRLIRLLLNEYTQSRLFWIPGLKNFLVAEEDNQLFLFARVEDGWKNRTTFPGGRAFLVPAPLELAENTGYTKDIN